MSGDSNPSTSGREPSTARASQPGHDGSEQATSDPDDPDDPDESSEPDEAARGGEERWIPTDPAVRAGAYTSIEDVPDHQRLKVYAADFEGRDCWHEFVTTEGLLRDGMPRHQRRYIERAGRRWKTFIERRGRHHALCTPADADAYAHHIQAEYPVNVDTASEYWATIERFYRWMFRHADYPHRYHPFLMAAANHDASNELWHQALDEPQPTLEPETDG